MTKSIVQCGLLLVATAGVVLAGPGTNLRWSNCFADAGVRNRSGTCAANTGANLLVGSFEIPAALAAVTGIQIRMDIAVAGDSLPAWWRLNAHECRWGSLSLNSSLSGTAAKCSDWAKGAPARGPAAHDEEAVRPRTPPHPPG